MLPAASTASSLSGDAVARDGDAMVYARGELVWGKIKGFPWWPAQVRSVKGLADEPATVRTLFLHTNDNVTLDLERLGSITSIPLLEIRR